MVLTSVLRDLFRSPSHHTQGLLSVVVNFYNNRREARNTLHCLTRAYQLDAQDIPYEVIALDNGSTQPLSDAEVRSFGPEFRYRFVPTRSMSPVEAINQACREAAGQQVLVMVDGAHLITPRVFRLVREAFRRFARPFVATVPFQLGPTKQNLSVQRGYNQDVEDRLLEACGWKENGYRLYSVSASLADESGGGDGQLFESGCFAMRKADYLALGGFDERFQSRGGGLANLDFFQRALSRRDLDYVVLLGEGTFHQVHGGVSTSAPMDAHPWEEYHLEYKQIRGHRFIRVPREATFIGEVPEEAAQAVEFSKRVGSEIWRKYPAVSY
jgi:glycosyltransferase involved in cell wall biosynthesis